MGYYELYYNAVIHDDMDNGEYELYHHGVLGQKWGVRRTAAQLGRRVAGAASKTGKVLYKGTKATGKAVGKGASKVGKAAKKAAVAKVKKTVAETKEKNYYKKLKKKKLSQMTDKEIEDLTKRVKTEASLKDAKYESRVQNARKFYKNVAQQPINTFLATYSKKAIESMFDDKSDGDNGDGGNKQETKKNEGGSKPKKQKNSPSNIEVEVTTEGPKKSSGKGIKAQKMGKRERSESKKAFDDYFESEVLKEQERRKNPPIIRR